MPSVTLAESFEVWNESRIPKLKILYKCHLAWLSIAEPKADVFFDQQGRKILTALPIVVRHKLSSRYNSCGNKYNWSEHLSSEERDRRPTPIQMTWTWQTEGEREEKVITPKMHISQKRKWKGSKHDSEESEKKWKAKGYNGSLDEVWFNKTSRKANDKKTLKSKWMFTKIWSPISFYLKYSKEFFNIHAGLDEKAQGRLGGCQV